MLEKSFLHLPGIGAETEKRLWDLGMKSWDDLEQNLDEVFPGKKASRILEALEGAREAHESGEFDYFRNLLKGPDMWRLVPSLLKKEMGHKIAYLDIETTGLGFPPQSHSTTIAVAFDGQLHVEHEGKKKYKLLQEIEREAKLFVTFNGICFDLPFLRREFDLSFSQVHLDLRFWFARLDFKGGLKKIQSSFSEVPQRDYMDIDGFDAVRLWALHQRGVDNALETLMTYNAEDTVVLESLMYCGLNLEAEKRKGLNLETYPMPKPLPIATKVCPKVYQLLRGEM